MDKIMQQIEKEAWKRFKVNEISSCNCLVWVYNMIAIELGMPERLELKYSHMCRVWQLDKEYLGGRSNV